ncbi:MAG: RAMP superfamily CRISPR-associated protein [Bacillota bacterium]
MLKRLVNECIMELAIQPDGPILIKSGIETIAGPSMAFVQTYRNGRSQVYLPGSSIKGVLRSHAERIVRTFGEDKACSPLKDDGPNMSCGRRFDKRKKRFNEEPTPPEVYAALCPICRLFGSTWYAGRLATADAYAEGPVRLEQRDGVGIDRFTGGAASGAKFDMEVVISGTFVTTLHVRNFELAQLGLIGFLLQDLKDGLVRMGMGKSKGLGKVTAQVRSVRVDYLGRGVAGPSDGLLSLRGVGDFLPDDTARQYGLARPDAVEVCFEGEWRAGLGSIRSSALFPGDSFPWREVAPSWVRYIEAYEVCAEMHPGRFQEPAR